MTNDVGFTAEQKAQLSAKLDRSNVTQRSHAGRSLSYIEAWHAIAEANRIFGFDSWNRETTDMKLVDQVEMKTRAGRDAWRVAYTAQVRVEVVAAGNRSISRSGTGFGQGIDADLGLAHESAVKEAESDAMKRALMTFGNPFGLALYDKTQAEVLDTQAGTYVAQGVRALVRPPAGKQTEMPQGAVIEPIAPAGPVKQPYKPKRAMGGPAPSLLQRATTEADRGTFAYEVFWKQSISTEEREELGGASGDIHKQLKALAELADQRAAAV